MPPSAPAATAWCARPTRSTSPSPRAGWLENQQAPLRRARHDEEAFRGALVRGGFLPTGFLVAGFFAVFLAVPSAAFRPAFVGRLGRLLNAARCAAAKATLA